METAPFAALGMLAVEERGGVEWCSAVFCHVVDVSTAVNHAFDDDVDGMARECCGEECACIHCDGC